MLINFNPLLAILAANPEISPTIPPPMLIKQSFLLKFLVNKKSTIFNEVLIFLFFSLLLITIK